VGRGIIALGGGRTTMADAIDPAVGFVITAKPGDWVESGEPLASVYARDRAGIDQGRAALRAALSIADEAEPPLPLVSHRITKAGVEMLV
jgi:thymidine phosphorylase